MQELTLAYHEWLYNQNERRIKEQKKQHYYYVGEENKIKKYLTKALEITYAPEDIEEMQFNFVNLTKKVIDQMAVVYREPAIRYYSGAEESETVAEELTEIYNEALPENINAIDKKAHRYAKLSNVSLTLVLMDKEKKEIKYIVEPIWKYNVEFDDEDPTKIRRLSYPKYYKDSKGEDELFTIVWTDTEHYKLDALGNRVAIKDNKQMVNPYDKIPVADLNFFNGDGYFGEGQNDLVNVNEQLNVLLTKMVSNDVIYGSEGTDLAINLGLDRKGTIEGGFRKVRRGRKHPLVVEQPMGDDRVASFSHVTPTVMITEIREFIDWYIKYIASLKGLNPSAILSQLKDTSDYQKIMDAVDQMEMRKDDIEYLRIYEKKRQEITKLVWNTHAQELGMEEINDDDFDFKVDFAEVEIHKTTADIQAEREFELKYNISTPIGWLMEDNPDLTEEEAEELLMKNRAFNSTLTRPISRLESMITEEETEVAPPIEENLVEE
jgi:hypothetical protein